MSESPGQARSRAFASIPAPSRGSLDHLCRSKLSSLPPLSWRRALQGGELDAPDAERRKASRLVERSGRGPVTARPVDHRLTLDPCGLAYSLLRPPASTPKVVLARGWTTGLTARVSGPARRDEMGRAGRPGPAGEGLARDETGIRARAAGSIALTSSGGGRLAGRNRGRDPKGDALFIRGTGPKPASADQGPWSR